MSDYVLLHGAWHGAWCWERIIPKLVGRGHRATAVDLRFGDPTVTAADWVAMVEDAIDRPEDTVVVAHSMSGYLAPHVRASELVLLAALVPGAPEVIRPEFIQEVGRQKDDAWDPDDAYTFFYHDCERADADLAIKQLTPMAPPTSLSEEPRNPGVPTRYIVCTEDRVIDRDISARVARARYDAEIVEIDAAHSPFWSKPAELADLITGSRTTAGA
jgi:pimeloyl-ACP methyl ester carboxylesterase